MIIDTISGKEIAQFPFDHEPAERISVSPDGQRVLRPLKDGIQLLDLNSGAIVAHLVQPKGVVQSVDIAVDVGLLATGGREGAVKVWDLTTNGKPMNFPQVRGSHRLSTPHAMVLDVEFSLDRKKVVAAFSDAVAKVFELSSATQIAALESQEGSIWRAIFSPDGTRIATLSGVLTVRVWDAETGVQVFSKTGVGEAIPADIAYSPDGTHFFIAAGEYIHVWDAHTGEEERGLPVGSSNASSVAVSAPGDVVIAGDKAGAIHAWNIQTGEKTAELMAHEGAVQSLKFLTDTQRLVSVGRDGVIRVWDTSHWLLEGQFQSDKGPALDIDTSEDGRLLVFGGRGGAPGVLSLESRK